MRTDKRNHFLHVTARDGFEFGVRQFRRIDRHSALGAAVGQIGQRAFPAHPHGERRRLAHGEMKVRSACRPWSARGRCDVERDNPGTLSCCRRPCAPAASRRRRASDKWPIPIVLVDVEVIGDDLKLVAGHLEKLRRRRSSSNLQKRSLAICAGRIEPSTPKVRQSDGLFLGRALASKIENSGKIDNGIEFVTSQLK